MPHAYTHLLHTVYPPPPPPHTHHFFLLFDCDIPLFGPLSFPNGAFVSVPNTVWAHKMVYNYPLSDPTITPAVNMHKLGVACAHPGGGGG